MIHDKRAGECRVGVALQIRDGPGRQRDGVCRIDIRHIGNQHRETKGPAIERLDFGNRRAAVYRQVGRTDGIDSDALGKRNVDEGGKCSQPSAVRRRRRDDRRRRGLRHHRRAGCRNGIVPASTDRRNDQSIGSLPAGRHLKDDLRVAAVRRAVLV